MSQTPLAPAPSQACRSQTLRSQVLHLFVLSGFAIAQPIYDRLGERSAYLVDLQVEAQTIVWLAVLFSLVIPGVLALILAATSRVAPRARDSVMAVMCLVLLTLGAAPLVKRVTPFLPALFQLAVIIVAGVAATWAYFRFARVRMVVSVATPAVLIFPALFLLTTPVARHFFFGHREMHTAHWNPVPVVFVVLDEFCSMSVVNEQREIDAERFPNLAKLAGGATWYRNSTSVFPDTWQALPSMLSGRYPTTAWAPTVADLPQNLFSVIEATGAYEWTAFEPVSRLAPRQPVRRTAEAPSVARQITSILPTLQKVLLFHIAPTELQKRLPEIPKLWFGLHEVSDVDPTQRRGVIRYGLGDDRQQQFNHFLHCLTDSEQPQLFFCHVLLPHIPWCYLPSGRKCLAETQAWELLSDDALIDELYAEQSQQRYLLQLQYTDLQVGRLLDRLHAVGLYDKCLLIVTADHGVSFKKNDLRRAVTDTNLADILPVPLFIKLPGQQQGEISDRNVESVDILPTVAHVLGIDLPLPVDGVSILGTPDQRTDKRYQTAQTLGFQPCHCPAEIARQSTVPEEIRQRFGPASDPAALFRIGPFPELIGKSSSDYARGEGPGATIRLRNGNAVYSSDPDAIVPCYLEGRVIEPAVVLEPVQLAVAVNGTIWATTRTYQADIYRDRFAVMLPETALREGANDIQWFVVTKTGTELRLHPCPTASD